jgi:hypothetical protein
LKKYFFAVLLSITTFLALPARPQTPTTNLLMGAYWDDGSIMQGTVSLGRQNASGPDTVIVTKTLSGGWAHVSEPLGATTMYDITLLTAAGTQLVKFPTTTAMINPGNLKQAEIEMIFRKADNSVKSATITVSLGF